MAELTPHNRKHKKEVGHDKLNTKEEVDESSQPLELWKILGSIFGGSGKKKSFETAMCNPFDLFVAGQSEAGDVDERLIYDHSYNRFVDVEYQDFQISAQSAVEHLHSIPAFHSLLCAVNELRYVFEHMPYNKHIGRQCVTRLHQIVILFGDPMTGLYVSVMRSSNTSVHAYHRAGLKEAIENIERFVCATFRNLKTYCDSELTLQHLLVSNEFLQELERFDSTMRLIVDILWNRLDLHEASSSNPARLTHCPMVTSSQWLASFCNISKLRASCGGNLAMASTKTEEHDKRRRKHDGSSSASSSSSSSTKNPYVHILNKELHASYSYNSNISNNNVNTTTAGTTTTTNHAGLLAVSTSTDPKALDIRVCSESAALALKAHSLLGLQGGDATYREQDKENSESTKNNRTGTGGINLPLLHNHRYIRTISNSAVRQVWIDSFGVSCLSVSAEKLRDAIWSAVSIKRTAELGERIRTSPRNPSSPQFNPLDIMRNSRECGVNNRSRSDLWAAEALSSDVAALRSFMDSLLDYRAVCSGTAVAAMRRNDVTGGGRDWSNDDANTTGVAEDISSIDSVVGAPGDTRMISVLDVARCSSFLDPHIVDIREAMLVIGRYLLPQSSSILSLAAAVLGPSSPHSPAGTGTGTGTGRIDVGTGLATSPRNVPNIRPRVVRLCLFPPVEVTASNSPLSNCLTNRNIAKCVFEASHSAQPLLIPPPPQQQPLTQGVQEEGGGRVERKLVPPTNMTMTGKLPPLITLSPLDTSANSEPITHLSPVAAPAAAASLILNVPLPQNNSLLVWEAEEEIQLKRLLFGRPHKNVHLRCPSSPSHISSTSNTRGWRLLYGPRGSGKTSKLLSCLHSVTSSNNQSSSSSHNGNNDSISTAVLPEQRHIFDVKDVIYFNARGCTNEFELVSALSNQLLVEHGGGGATFAEAVIGLRGLLQNLEPGSCVIFDNFDDFGMQDIEQDNYLLGGAGGDALGSPVHPDYYNMTAHGTGLRSGQYLGPELSKSVPTSPRSSSPRGQSGVAHHTRSDSSGLHHSKEGIHRSHSRPRAGGGGGGGGARVGPGQTTTSSSSASTGREDATPTATSRPTQTPRAKRSHSFDVLFHVFGALLQEFSDRLRFLLVYSSNDAAGIETTFRERRIVLKSSRVALPLHLKRGGGSSRSVSSRDSSLASPRSPAVSVSAGATGLTEEVNWYIPAPYLRSLAYEHETMGEGKQNEEKEEEDGEEEESRAYDEDRRGGGGGRTGGKQKRERFRSEETAQVQGMQVQQVMSIGPLSHRAAITLGSALVATQSPALYAMLTSWNSENRPAADHRTTEKQKQQQQQLKKEMFLLSAAASKQFSVRVKSLIRAGEGLAGRMVTMAKMLVPVDIKRLSALVTLRQHHTRMNYHSTSAALGTAAATPRAMKSNETTSSSSSTTTKTENYSSLLAAVGITEGDVFSVEKILSALGALTPPPLAAAAGSTGTAAAVSGDTPITRSESVNAESVLHYHYYYIPSSADLPALAAATTAGAAAAATAAAATTTTAHQSKKVEKKMQNPKHGKPKRNKEAMDALQAVDEEVSRLIYAAVIDRLNSLTHDELQLLCCLMGAHFEVLTESKRDASAAFFANNHSYALFCRKYAQKVDAAKQQGSTVPNIPMNAPSLLPRLSSVGAGTSQSSSSSGAIVYNKPVVTFGSLAGSGEGSMLNDGGIGSANVLGGSFDIQLEWAMCCETFQGDASRWLVAHNSLRRHGLLRVVASNAHPYGTTHVLHPILFNSERSSSSTAVSTRRILNVKMSIRIPSEWSPKQIVRLRSCSSKTEEGLYSFEMPITSPLVLGPHVALLSEKKPSIKTGITFPETVVPTEELRLLKSCFHHPQNVILRRYWYYLAFRLNRINSVIAASAENHNRSDWYGKDPNSSFVPPSSSPRKEADYWTGEWKEAGGDEFRGRTRVESFSQNNSSGISNSNSGGGSSSSSSITAVPRVALSSLEPTNSSMDNLSKEAINKGICLWDFDVNRAHFKALLLGFTLNLPQRLKEALPAHSFQDSFFNDGDKELSTYSSTILSNRAYQQALRQHHQEHDPVSPLSPATKSEALFGRACVLDAVAFMLSGSLCAVLSLRCDTNQLIYFQTAIVLAAQRGAAMNRLAGVDAGAVYRRAARETLSHSTSIISGVSDGSPPQAIRRHITEVREENDAEEVEEDEIGKFYSEAAVAAAAATADDSFEFALYTREVRVQHYTSTTMAACDLVALWRRDYMERVVHAHSSTRSTANSVVYQLQNVVLVDGKPQVVRNREEELRPLIQGLQMMTHMMGTSHMTPSPKLLAVIDHSATTTTTTTGASSSSSSSFTSSFIRSFSVSTSSFKSDRTSKTTPITNKYRINNNSPDLTSINSKGNLISASSIFAAPSLSREEREVDKLRQETKKSHRDVHTLPVLCKARVYCLLGELHATLFCTDQYIELDVIEAAVQSTTDTVGGGASAASSKSKTKKHAARREPDQSSRRAMVLQHGNRALECFGYALAVLDHYPSSSSSFSSRRSASAGGKHEPLFTEDLSQAMFAVTKQYIDCKIAAVTQHKRTHYWDVLLR